jgi:3-oxoacyl-(acyl-carrier-protein) synthase
VTIIHGAEGPSNTITCGESSGLLSIGESARVIERGAADACFSGGAESKVSLMGLLRMDLTGRLAPTGDGDEGPRVVKPYDSRATGTLASEAGALAILEEESAARARGIDPYCRVAGFGAAQSAVLETGTNGAGGALALAIRRALADAGASPEDVSAIVPGATGIPRVDADEADALRAVFGARLRDIPLVTVTPNMGLAAAGQGAVLAAVGALCVRSQALPARVHAGTCPDDLQAGPAPARSATLDLVVVCCSSLGGQCAALVLARA